MVPKGWTLTTFESHIDILSGFAFKSASYTDNKADIKLLRGDNIEPGALRWRDAKRWPISNGTELAKYNLNEGDFVIAMDRTWISSGLKVAEIKHSDLPCLLVQRVARIRAKETLEQGLLRQYFSSHNFEQYVKSVQTETAVPHISSRQIKDFPLLLPPRQEQTKIAQILSTWDKAIATSELLLANSQQQKQALMQRLLTGQTRFAGFTEDWMTIEFDELLDIEIGGTPSRSIPAYWDPEKITNNRWLSIADLKGNLITDTSEYISDLGIAKSNTKLIPAGTIVMSFKLTIGRRAILAADTYTNEAICALKIKDPERLNNDFLFHALCLVNFEQDIDQAVKGKTLNKAKLKQLTLNLPSLPEQQKIAQVLSTADAEIANLQAQLDKLKLEKKALMQQLLTGKRRVRLDDEEEDMAPIRRVG